MQKILRAIRIAVPGLIAAVFLLWLLDQERPFSPGTLFAALSAWLFALALTAALTRFAQDMTETKIDPLPAKDTWRERLRAWTLLGLFGIAVTLLQYAAVYLLVPSGETFSDSFREFYYRSDVAHYMGIAEDWYVPVGDERLRLVFLPLYPLTIRIMTVYGDYFIGAFLSAQLFSLLCLPAAYELFRLDMDRWDAMSCARMLFLLPGGAFLRIPMSEGLFLFFTLLAVYFARKHRFLLAGLFTALSALTRSLGILLLGLLLVEMLTAFMDAWRKDRQGARRLLPSYIGSLLLGCCGTAIYLFINWQISGSPFTFLIYQRENWNQRMGLFFNTAGYLAEYGLLYYRNGDMASVLSLSLPNLLCLFGTLGLLCQDRKRMRTSYLLWSLAYFAAAIGATWLLSGPRYLAMLFPLAIALCRLSKKPGVRLAMEGGLLLCQTGYLVMLALDWSVY